MASKLKGFKIGNREKIAIGFLGMLLFIALTHLVLYRPKSVELTQVNEKYNRAFLQYQDYASKNLPADKLKQLDTEVVGLDTLLKTAIEKFEIGKENEFVASGPVFLKALDDIKEMEKRSNKPKINVLSGWTITDDIPGLEPARIPDYLEQLKQKKAILSMSNISDDLKLNFEAQYRELLQRMGFNKDELAKLNPFIAWLKQFKMFNYIKQHKGTGEYKDGELIGILDIPMYDPSVLKLGMFFLMRSKEILEIAEHAQVDTISDVKIYSRKEIRPGVKATPTPKATVSPLFGGEEFMAEGRGGPGAMFPGMRGRFPGMFGLTPTPTPQLIPPSAVSLPIEVSVTGDNITITKFLYGITHSPHLMDIRDMDIVVQEEGKLTAKITINCYREIKAVDDLKKVASVVATPKPKP